MSPLVLLSLFVQTGLDTAVDMDVRGRDLPAVIQDLAQKTGLRMETVGLSDRPLIVNVHEMPASKLLATICETTDASVEMRNGTITIFRPTSRVTEGRIRAARNRGLRAKTWLQSNTANQTSGPWGDNDFEFARLEAERLYTKGIEEVERSGMRLGDLADAITPARIVLLDFLRRVKPELIGDIQPESYTVFSTSPSGREVPMPVDLSAAVRHAMAARERAAQILHIREDEAIVRNNTALLSEPVAEIRQVKVVLSRSWSSRVDAEVYLIDKRVVDYSGIRIDAGLAAMDDCPADLSGNLVLTEFDRALIQMLPYASLFSSEAVYAGGRNLVDPPAEWLRSQLVDPVTNEPMSTLPASWLRSTADALKLDLVGYVPDSAYAVLLDRMRAKPDLRALWKMRKVIGVELEVRGNALVCRPVEQWAADRGRVDRNALRKLLRTYTSSSLPRLEDFLAYLDKSPTFAEYNLDTTWMKMLEPNGRVFCYLARPADIRLMNDLKLDRGADISNLDTSGLTPQQRNLLEESASGASTHWPDHASISSRRSKDGKYSISAPTSLNMAVGRLHVTRTRRHGYLLPRGEGFVPALDSEIPATRSELAHPPLRLDAIDFHFLPTQPGGTSAYWKAQELYIRPR